MDFIRSHKFIVATIAIQIVALPLILLLVKQQQETRTQAAQASTLYFEPSSNSSTPITKNLGEDFSVDLMVNPATNWVSLIKLEIIYDPTKITLSSTNPVIVNTAAFPTTIEGPVISNGKVQIVVSVGANQTQVIQTPTKVLTLNFKAAAITNQTSISFGANNLITSTSGADSGDANVLLLDSSTPATIKVNAAPTPTNTPSNTPTPTPAPPTKTPTPTPTKIPTPTPTPIPPTPTPVPPTIIPLSSPIPTLANTVINFTNMRLHGLGKGGDSPNPNSTGTLTPIRTVRPITVELLDDKEVLIHTLTSNITYAGSTNGYFNGSVTLPLNIVEGPYIIKVKTPYYLRRRIQGYTEIKKGQVYNIDAVNLVAGDADNDNKLETTDDYAIIIDCYSDLQAAKNCDATKKLAADLNDDNKVNYNDYNLFLRELSVQQGE